MHISPGTVARPGRWLARAGVDLVGAGRMLRGCGGTRSRSRHCSKPELGAHVAPILLRFLASGNFASRLLQHAEYNLADSSFWQKK